MIEWLKQLPSKIKELWAKWKPVQKGIFLGIVVLVIIAIVAMFRVSSAPTGVALFNTPFRNETDLDAVTQALDLDNIDYRVENNLIIVNDRKTAKDLKEKLVVAGVVPNYIDPFDVFNQSSWSDTDFERNVKLKNALQKQLKNHILSLDDIVMPML